MTVQPLNPTLSPSNGEREGSISGRVPRAATAGRFCPGLVSACPFGAAVCAESWPDGRARREAGLCLECWAGVLECASAHSEWLR
jgi:hypothetical protein